jgi:hypothetical protein
MEQKRTAWQASLSIAGETIGAAFHSAAGRRYPAASVARGAPAEAPGMERWLVERMLDNQREKTTPLSTSGQSGMASDCIFLAAAQTNQFALGDARALEPACFREAIGDPKAIRKARGGRG